MQWPYRGSGGPLHLFVDSTGIEVRGEGTCHARTHRGGKRRLQWREAHLATDEKGLEVQAAEITDGGVGGTPTLPSLIDSLPEGEPIASVTTASAYDRAGV